ncbi:acetyl-CoA carboxylase biotin carboxylase subunit family protein [Micromonospora sp. HUAS LYJ1]|uniref:ATP-grasp domain-containing protein n=1 Tax=Micromonospora sp. HUAS LYJ1 TaxID=3061626 RepID=UPI0026737422|nr:siderophore biosynthesis protein [Micromonospora sp. HUAS LYJ1]WKU07139.1 siderophore biosynthesis protein [Micromonospora sp. HUAS LYJ1]
MILYLVAGLPTDSITAGFLPAAARLGLDTVLLTDTPEPHVAAYADVAHPPGRVEQCAVHRPDDIIDAVRRIGPAVGVLSNGDGLQMSTALAADFLGLPGKNWRAALRCKDKAFMRQHLTDVGLESVRHAAIVPGAEVPPAWAAFPAVVKPRTGVASEDCYLVADRGDLVRRVDEIRRRHPQLPLVLEEYLPGELRTFETLGDAERLAVVGSWRTTLSPPPVFIEERHTWAPDLDPAVTGALLTALTALGVGLGACHAEFVLTPGGPRLIEVNYRLIGDRVDLVLAELLGVPLFEYVIRLHLGEKLEALSLPVSTRVAGHAVLHHVRAERGGRLRSAPGWEDSTTGGVHLTCRPIRDTGTHAPLRGTNRDHLAVVSAVGPDRERVETALTEFLAGNQWVIR